MGLGTYPPDYRRARRTELLATLAEGDAARGSASTREALALAAAGLRLRVIDPATPLVGGATMLLCSALLPGRYWLERPARNELSWPLSLIDGPGVAGRMMLILVAVLVLAMGATRLSRPACMRLGAGLTALVLAACWLRGPEGLSGSPSAAVLILGLAAAPVAAHLLTSPRARRWLPVVLTACAAAVVIDVLVREPLRPEQAGFVYLEAPVTEGFGVAMALACTGLACLVAGLARARSADPHSTETKTLSQ